MNKIGVYRAKKEIHMKNTISKLVFLVGASFVMASCGSAQDTKINVGGIEIHDPFEETNRSIFAFNSAVDDAVIHPIIEGYRYVVPELARTGLRNFLRHLKSPMRLANQLLQGDLDGAGTVVIRTVVNTFVGVGGLFDVAGYEGIEYEPEDFGQTLAVWGVDHGAYMVVPFFGPASVRDGTGFVVDAFADPLRWYANNIDEEEWYYIKAGLDYLNLRDSLMDVLRDLDSSSIDYYAAVRSAYYQNRDAMVKDQSSERLSSSASVVEEGYGWDDY